MIYSASKNRIDLENWVMGCSRVLKIAPFDRPCTTFQRTDGRTDILPRHSPRYAYASRGNKCRELVHDVRRRHEAKRLTVNRSRHAYAMVMSYGRLPTEVRERCTTPRHDGTTDR